MKKLLLILLSVVLLFEFSNACFADELPSCIHEKEYNAIHGITGQPSCDVVNKHHGEIISPSRFICSKCGWFCVTVCAAEARLDGTNTHGDCLVYYFSSRGAMMCPTCQIVYIQYGYHDCWEIHKSCWKGDYDVCPMEVS